MAPRSTPDLVLITGVTGHIGFSTLIKALQAGYNVRAVVRSEDKASFILSRPQIQALGPSPRLSFVIVPDITKPGAYDAATQGVTHIIHIASPLATGDSIPLSKFDTHFIQPAVQGTLGMLEAARQSTSVRRVVITSSITALIPTAQMEGREPRLETSPILPTDRISKAQQDEDGPCMSEFGAYAASKIAALRQAEEWMARERPSFDIVHLHPGFVLGRNDVATTASACLRGTNSVVLAMLLGKTLGPFAGATVHVDDVARVHVASLDRRRVPGGQSYILSQPARWATAKEIVQKEFPEAMESRLLVTRGYVDTVDIPIDASLTERTFGIKFVGFEEQVKSLVGQFLDLRIVRQKSGSREQSAQVRRNNMVKQVKVDA